MEYCEKSTLRDMINEGICSETEKVARYFREIVEGLAHVHSQVYNYYNFFAQCSLKTLGTKLAEQFIIIINNSIFINKLIILSIFLMTSLKLLKYNIPAKKTRMNLTPLKLTVPL